LYQSEERENLEDTDMHGVKLLLGIKCRVVEFVQMAQIRPMTGFLNIEMDFL
jgi:hypothetical protein